MIKINKKAVIIAALAILVVAAGIINWSITANKASAEASKPSETPKTDTYADFRTERERVRSQELTNLDSVINNENTDTETLAEAQKMKLDITGIMESELLVEGLLKAKGFQDVIMTIGSDSVNVVIKEQELSQSQVAQILEVVTRETQADPMKIKIIQTK